MFCAMPRTFENKQTTSEPLPREIQKTLYLSTDDPIPPASSPRIPIPRILLLLNLAYNASAMVHLTWVMLPQRY